MAKIVCQKSKHWHRKWTLEGTESSAHWDPKIFVACGGQKVVFTIGSFSLYIFGAPPNDASVGAIRAAAGPESRCVSRQRGRGLEEDKHIARRKP